MNKSGFWRSNYTPDQTEGWAWWTKMQEAAARMPPLKQPTKYPLTNTDNFSDISNIECDTATDESVVQQFFPKYVLYILQAKLTVSNSFVPCLWIILKNESWLCLLTRLPVKYIVLRNECTRYNETADANACVILDTLQQRLILPTENKWLIECTAFSAANGIPCNLIHALLSTNAHGFVILISAYSNVEKLFLVSE